MRSGLHEAVSKGDCKMVSKLIVAGVDVNEASILGESPLYYPLDNNEPTIGAYRAVILLLEAGANPLQPQPGNKLWKVDYPLFSALREHHLAQVLLLLWYVVEDYKTIKMISAEGDGFCPTLQRYIEITGKIEAEEGKHRDYVRWVNETAADAKEVRSLLAEAKRCLETAPRTVESDTKAARCYRQAAQIYQKHEELEDSLVYFRPSYMYDDSATPKQLHALFKDYYRQKKLSCLENEFNCVQRVERGLTTTDEEGVKHHIEVINRLIELSKLLVKKADLPFYLNRAAEVMIRLPDRRASEATTVSDDEVVVELHERAEVDSERASLLEHKPATTSIFGALSTLRRRYVPVAAAEVGHDSPVPSFKI